MAVVEVFEKGLVREHYQRTIGFRKGREARCAKKKAAIIAKMLQLLLKFGACPFKIAKK